MTELALLLSRQDRNEKNRLIECRPERGKLIQPQGVVKKEFLEEVTYALSRRTKSCDPWEKGIWDKFVCGSEIAGNQKLHSGACGWAFVL